MIGNVRFNYIPVFKDRSKNELVKMLSIAVTELDATRVGLFIIETTPS